MTFVASTDLGGRGICALYLKQSRYQVTVHMLDAGLRKGINIQYKVFVLNLVYIARRQYNHVN